MKKKTEELLKDIGDVKDKYIDEADCQIAQPQKNRIKTRIFSAVAVCAASICIVVALGRKTNETPQKNDKIVVTNSFETSVTSADSQHESVSDTIGHSDVIFTAANESEDTVTNVQTSENVIFMTDEGGIKVFPWLLLGANVLGKCRLHYIVIGGWLVHYLRRHGFIRACLKRYAGIYVETTIMKRELEKMGFRNIVLMPNFKPLSPLVPEQLPMCYDEPLRFCTFSRVMREKGIDDAVEAIRAVNSHFGRTVCTLDIYGQVDSEQKAWFVELRNSFPPEVRYGGVVDYCGSVEILKDYAALLFPTEFFTEGVPGTIIDAYAAGVPVIASRWESFADVIEDGATGVGYPFGQAEALKEILLSLVDDPRKLVDMKEACLKKAYAYQPEQVMDVLFQHLS